MLLFVRPLRIIMFFTLQNWTSCLPKLFTSISRDMRLGISSSSSSRGHSYCSCKYLLRLVLSNVSFNCPVLEFRSPHIRNETGHHLFYFLNFHIAVQNFQYHLIVYCYKRRTLHVQYMEMTLILVYQIQLH